MKVPTNYNRIQILAAAALASLAVAVAWSASASAYPVSGLHIRPAGSSSSPSAAAPRQVQANPSGAVGSSPTQVRVVRATLNPGFDWGDAGIGAGAAFALTMIGLGASLVVGNRRQRHARPATTA
jgi:hypothetical protein